MSPDIPDDFELITAMQMAKARAEDQHHLNDAMAGRDTSRGGRHIYGERLRAMISKRRASGELSALDMLLMSDPDYAALYFEVSDALAEAENAVETALDALNRRIEAAETAISEMESRAAQLRDGTLIFRDAETGRIFTADGGEITGHPDLEGAEWPTNAPDWAQYRAEQQQAAQARADRDEVIRYQIDVLGTARDRLDDSSNPPSREALEQMKRDIQDKAPPSLDKAIAAPNRSELNDRSDDPALIDVPHLSQN